MKASNGLKTVVKKVAIFSNSGTTASVMRVFVWSGWSIEKKITLNPSQIVKKMAMPNMIVRVRPIRIAAFSLGGGAGFENGRASPANPPVSPLPLVKSTSISPGSDCAGG